MPDDDRGDFNRVWDSKVVWCVENAFYNKIGSESVCRNTKLTYLLMGLKFTLM